jgi:hypothetical protein
MADFEHDSSDSEDEFFMNLAARGRRVKDVRPRIDNFNVWNDDQFFVRFRLTKLTVLHLLDLVEPSLETATDRLVSISLSTSRILQINTLWTCTCRTNAVLVM